MKTRSLEIGLLFRVVASLTAVLTFFLIIVGALVRVSGSGLGCPDWPLCHGQLIPPFDFHALVEYSHRLTATLVTIFTFSTAIWAWLRYRSHTWIFRSALLAVLLLIAQILLGGITVLTDLPPTVVAVHLGNAMLLFASVLTVATLAWRESPAIGRPLSHDGAPASDSALPTLGEEEGNDRSLLKLILASAAGVFIIILSGSFVEASGAGGACSSWPLCNGGQLVSPNSLAAIHMLHRFVVGVAGLLAIYTFYRAARAGSKRRPVLAIAIIGAAVLIVQVFVGAAQVWLQFPPLLEGAHVALASAVWGSLIILALLVLRREQLFAPEPVMDLPMQEESVGRRAASYFALTKPWIVALLLATTAAGMLVAARGLPPLNILLFTLLGGACAAGGANALNSYIDRDVDKVMGRTSRRPLPSGRVSPRAALLFALTLSCLSPVILGFGVNWLSAGLAVLGILYYAVIYTIFLKRATPQNIVVGGAAGAIPPLVGWAAVTNDLSLLSLYLFAIILLWTPPHTWALMLLLDKDYRRAKIPMLPAAWGQVEARRQIILYSVLLFVTTLVPFSFGALGLVYLSGAVILGIYFLVLALKLWRHGNSYKPIARKLYHFSNAYLALLFLAMVLDHWLPTWRV
jgi:heme o synthase